MYELRFMFAGIVAEVAIPIVSFSPHELTLAVRAAVQNCNQTWQRLGLAARLPNGFRLCI